MLQRIIIISTLIAIVALPFALRPSKPVPERNTESLVIITPHNEAIRHEYALGFEKWYYAKTGKSVKVDWRVIGGTSEIARFLEGEYVAAFQLHWTKGLGRTWSTEVQAGFQNDRLPADASQDAKDARDEFMKSNVSSGIDVFFGGGTYDFTRQARAGRIVDSGIMQEHPEWFTDDVIPAAFAGEEYWDKKGRWIGTVLSSYGMIYNRDSLERLGISGIPSQWTDLADPRYFGEVALADPTKSGSITKAFENIIQQQMQRRLNALEIAHPEMDKAEREKQAVREGWLAGMRLLQLVGANSRYFTDTSQKPPIDVAAGNCSVGLCIDFYGRQQQEAIQRRGNGNRVGYSSPAGGSVGSVDPVALMRGAPHEAAAKAFIEYVLSQDGQKLWNFKVGTPGGPEHFALRRLPVRRDFYSHTEWKEYRSDPEDAPYAQTDQLIYRGAWTGGLFREMAVVIRVMCLDTHEELKQAWRAVNDAGQPADAMAVLQDLSAVDYDQTSTVIKKALGSKNKVDEVRFTRELGDFFRANYRKAEELAKASGKH